MLKRCNDCGELLPIENFYLVWFKCRKKRYRLGHCKWCDNARHKKDYKKHRTKRLASKKNAYKKDPWYIRLQALYRRCPNGVTTTIDLKELVEKSKGICYYCGKKFGDDWTFDHSVSIVNGGTNDTENLRVCCLSCNSSKGSMNEIEFKIKLNGAPF